MLAGFQQFGLQPGPLLFVNNAPLVWGLIASLLVANLMLLVLNLPLIGLWVRLLTIPQPWLYAGILVFATLGTIGADGSTSCSSASRFLRARPAAAVRPARLRAAPLPLSDRAGGGRPDPRADGRAAAAPGAGDQPGRSVLALFNSWIAIVLWLLALTAVLLPLYLRYRGKGRVLEQIAGDSD